MNYCDEACLMIDMLMQKASSNFAKAKSQQFASQGLTSQQVSILLFLDKNGSAKVSEIADALKMVDSNVSNICSRLQKAGLVTRKRPDDDKRVVYIELTGAAEIKMEKIKNKVYDFRRRISERLSKQDLADVCKGLSILNDMLDMFDDAQEDKPSGHTG
ncbi:MAG: putative HTH-type transcriptional regulator YusO [Firmicutes bacterium ADurb.Bin262]|nr:MAG: putative HTH-type transcriptional regulator YusO [Firmicutes bacterium ADurb.Bin262]